MTNPFAQIQLGAPPKSEPASSILGQISSGMSQTGQRIVLTGVEKVGKTTLATNAPRALLVPLEVGYAAVSTPKVPMLTSYEAVMQLIAEIKAACQAGTFEAKSIVFDTATALERLIHDAVLRRDPSYHNKNAKALTMEAALGGYGKAYQFANELFDDFTKACDELAIYGGLNIIVTCHVFASKVNDPLNGEYDTWDLLLHSPKNAKNYGKREMITQWADMVGFLHEPLFVQKTEGEQIARGITMNQGRVLAVDRQPGFVAGNRYGISGNIAIPKVNGWNSLAHQIYNASEGKIDVFNRDVG